MEEKLSPALHGLLFCVLLNLPHGFIFGLTTVKWLAWKKPLERPSSVLGKNVDWIFSLRCAFFSSNYTAFKIEAGLYEI